MPSSKTVWLFDLDNTLHDANPHIFPHINRSMREYIERHLGLDESAATEMRQGYWVRYGATLLGLIRHHAVEPRHFLRETHAFQNLKTMVVFERAIKHMIRRLPGRKIVFSNAPRHYVVDVLDIVGLTEVFSAVYAIENVDFQPKPLPASFRSLLRAERVAPARCIMVEDSLANLAQAKKLGMKTVWVSANSRGSSYVDVKLANILDLPGRLRSL